MKIKTLIFLVFTSQIIKAQVVFKNNGFSKLYIAICYYEKQNGFKSTGWFQLEPNSTQAVYSISKFTNRNFYYCATIDNCDKGYFGETQIYVDKVDKFTINNADKQQQFTNKNIKPMGFRKIDLLNKTTDTVVLTPTNLTCYYKKEGKWVFGLDKDLQYVEKKEDIRYYREITFKDNQPIGWCKDYYENESIKAEFKLLSFDPEIMDGKCTFYDKNGSVISEQIIDNSNNKNAAFYSNAPKIKYNLTPVENTFLDEILRKCNLNGLKSKVVNACNYKNSTVRNLAVKLAGKNPGEYNIGQACDIFDYAYKNWKYVNDPKQSEYFSTASNTILASFNGDCDDFATLMCALILSIGGEARVNFAQTSISGHAFTEINLGRKNIQEIKEYLIKRYYLNEQLYFRKDQVGNIWLNFDWSAKHPGGEYFGNSGTSFYIIQNYCEAFEIRN